MFADVIHFDDLEDLEDGRLQSVYPAYDVPHAAKSVRNNLMKHQLLHTTAVNEHDIMDWTILKAAYDDSKSTPGDMDCLPKITEAHIFPDKCPKMRTKYAFQVLSLTMATYINLRAGNQLSDIIPHIRGNVRYTVLFIFCCRATPKSSGQRPA